MKNITLALVVGVLAIAATGVVRADSVAGASATTPSDPFTVKIGAAFTTQGASTTVLAGGLDYAFEKNSNTTNPVLPSIYVDAFNKNSDTLVGAGVAIRSYTSAPGSATAPYVGIGIGDYFTTSGHTTNGFGGKVFAGVELPSHWLGEVNYTDRFSGGSTGAVGVEVGYRF